MKWWLELRISQLADQRTIRSAYANQIKRFHPETHPERFQRLRKAYEQALAAQGGNILHADGRPIVKGPVLAVRKLFHRPMPHIGEQAVELLAQVAWLFRNPTRPYKQIGCWQEIFADQRLWNIECREQFSDGLFSILIKQLKCDDPRINRICMSRDIWKLINRELAWVQTEASLFVRFGAIDAEWVMRNVHTALGHTYFHAGDGQLASSTLVWGQAGNRGVPVLVWAVLAAAVVGLIRISIG